MPRVSSTLSHPLPWGSHLCAFYRSGGDLQTLAGASFIEAGLEDHEGCLWILSVWLSAWDATTALQRPIPQIHDYMRTGQLGTRLLESVVPAGGPIRRRGNLRGLHAEGSPDGTTFCGATDDG